MDMSKSKEIVEKYDPNHCTNPNHIQDHEIDIFGEAYTDCQICRSMMNAELEEAGRLALEAEAGPGSRS